MEAGNRSRQTTTEVLYQGPLSERGQSAKEAADITPDCGVGVEDKEHLLRLLNEKVFISRPF